MSHTEDHELSAAGRETRPARRDPPWTFEEQTLAFQLCREKYPQSAKEPRVLEVSSQLRALEIHPVNVRTTAFRSPDSVSRKLGDIATHAPDYAGKPTTGSKLDRDIWLHLGHLKDAELSELVEQILSGARVRAKRVTSTAGGARAQDFDEVAVRGGFRLGTTRQRRGQQKFRDKLVALGGPYCLILGDSGPLPLQVLEACHLYSYAKTGEHLPGGGALMRRDLHTLFDRDLIVIHPATWDVYLAPELRAVPAYSDLHLRPAATRWRDHVEPQLLQDRLYEARIDLDADRWPANSTS